MLLPGYLLAQVTFVIQSLPQNTPADPTIFISGDFNDWDPGNVAYQLQKNAQGKYQITLNLLGTIKFKFTRGVWATVEGDINGGEISDRTTQVQVGQVLNFDVLSWKDLEGSGSTALPTVKLMDDLFPMPGLHTTRRIWICLPPDYETNTTKRYPVVYMQDGQNLFDAQLAFGGNEWKVDETMKQLFDAGNRGAIVVGIENAGMNRIAEYTPWVNTSYESGQGGLYATFLAENLKPYIDSHYRTFTEPKANALMGSSLGGLISLYAMLQYPESFGKAGIFSPAFWINKEDLFSWNGLEQAPDKWVYLVAGSNESSSMVPDMQQMRDLLQENQVGDINYKVVSGGTHNEQFWSTVYGPAYSWLFRDQDLLAIENQSKSMDQASVFPCPFNSFIKVKKQQQEVLQITITDMTGRIVLRSQLGVGEEQLEVELPTGVYQFSALGNKGSLLNRRILSQP